MSQPLLWNGFGLPLVSCVEYERMQSMPAPTLSSSGRQAIFTDPFFQESIYLVYTVQVIRGGRGLTVLSHQDAGPVIGQCPGRAGMWLPDFLPVFTRGHPRLVAECFRERIVIIESCCFSDTFRGVIPGGFLFE